MEHLADLLQQHVTQEQILQDKVGAGPFPLSYQATAGNISKPTAETTRFTTGHGDMGKWVCHLTMNSLTMMCALDPNEITATNRPMMSETYSCNHIVTLEQANCLLLEAAAKLDPMDPYEYHAEAIALGLKWKFSGVNMSLPSNYSADFLDIAERPLVMRVSMHDNMFNRFGAAMKGGDSAYLVLKMVPIQQITDFTVEPGEIRAAFKDKKVLMSNYKSPMAPQFVGCIGRERGLTLKQLSYTYEGQEYYGVPYYLGLCTHNGQFRYTAVNNWEKDVPQQNAEACLQTAQMIVLI